MIKNETNGTLIAINLYLNLIDHGGALLTLINVLDDNSQIYPARNFIGICPLHRRIFRLLLNLSSAMYHFEE